MDTVTEPSCESQCVLPPLNLFRSLFSGLQQFLFLLLEQGWSRDRLEICPLLLFSIWEKIIKQNKKALCSEGDRVILGVGLPSGKSTIPVLVQCLQRFRAPKVGCASSSLNSSEHCMGLFAAPEWRRQKYNRFDLRKGSRPGSWDVNLSRLAETLAGQLTASSKQDQPSHYILLAKVLSFVIDISVPSATQSVPHQPWLSVLLPPFPFLGCLTVLKAPHFIPGEFRAAQSCYGHTLCCLKWRQPTDGTERCK